MMDVEQAMKRARSAQYESSADAQTICTLAREVERLRGAVPAGHVRDDKGGVMELPAIGSRWIRVLKNGGRRVGRTNLDTSSMVTVDAHEGNVVVFRDGGYVYREEWPPEGDTTRYEEVKP